MSDEDLMTRTLLEVTAGTTYPSTPLSAVVARARTVRARRRRVAALAAVAAVAVVVAPGAVWLSRAPGTRSGPPVATTTTPSPTVSAGSSTSLTDLPFGHEPGIAYLDGSTYLDLNGGRTRDPALATATTATPVREGLLFALPGQSPDRADLWVHTTGGDQRLGCGRARFAVSDDSVETAYWVMDSCSTGSAGRLYTGADNTMGEGGAGFVSTPGGELVDPVGIQPGSVVVNAWRGQDPTAELIDSATGTATPLSTLRVVSGSDENHRVVSGELAGQPPGQPGENAVVDATTGSVAWRTDWQLGPFSADGRYVVGLRPGNGGPDSYAAFDAVTGAKVADLPTWSPGWISQVAWDTDDTLLAVVDDGSDHTAVVRFALDGHVTRATPVREQSSSSADVFRLATRP